MTLLVCTLFGEQRKSPLGSTLLLTGLDHWVLPGPLRCWAKPSRLSGVLRELFRRVLTGMFFFFFELNIYIEVVEEWSIDRAYCTDSSRHPEILWWRFIVQFRCFWVRFMFEIMGKLLDTKQLKTYWCDPPCQPWTYIYIYSSIENLHKTKTIHNSCRSFTFKVGFCIVFTRESSSWLYNI